MPCKLYVDATSSPLHLHLNINSLLTTFIENFRFAVPGRDGLDFSLILGVDSEDVDSSS